MDTPRFVTGLSGAVTVRRGPDSSLSARCHRPRIVCPMEFQFIRQRTREAIEIGKQIGLRNVHAIQLAHAFFANFIRGYDEFDQRVVWVWVFLQNFFDGLIQDRRHKKRPGLSNQPAIHRVWFTKPYEGTGTGQKELPKAAW